MSGCYMYSRPEYLETMVASYKARAVPINVNYRYVGEELAYLFDDAELRVLVLEAGFAPIVASIRKQLPHLDHFIVVDDGSDEAEALPDAVAYEDVLAANVPTAGLRTPVRRRPRTSPTPAGPPASPRGSSGATRTSSSPP